MMENLDEYSDLESEPIESILTVVSRKRESDAVAHQRRGKPVSGNRKQPYESTLQKMSVLSLASSKVVSRPSRAKKFQFNSLINGTSLVLNDATFASSSSASASSSPHTLPTLASI